MRPATTHHLSGGAGKAIGIKAVRIYHGNAFRAAGPQPTALTSSPDIPARVHESSCRAKWSDRWPGKA